MTPPHTEVLLVPSNISPSLISTSHLLSTKFLNLCTDPPLSTFKPWVGAYSIDHPPVPFKLTLMLPGPVAPMTKNPRVVFASSLFPTLFFGHLVNIATLPAQAMNLNIAPSPSPSPSPPLNSSGSNPYFVTLVYLYPIPLHYGAIILAPPTYLTIMSSIPTPNTMKSTSILSVIKLPPTP
jgi:hypothetical protein